MKLQFVKPEWVWSYVEAGIRVRYSHVTHVPANAVAILVWAELNHDKDNDDDFHAAQKVFAIIEGKLVADASGSSPNKSLQPTGTADATIPDSKVVEAAPAAEL